MLQITIICLLYVLYYSLTLLTTHIKSFDITTFDRLNFRKANPVGIRAGSELQNGFGVVGDRTTSSSSSTKTKKFNYYDICLTLYI